MNKRLWALALLIFWARGPVVRADDGFDETLARARRLVEEKSYEEALAVYDRIAEGLKKDPGLMIEWARVHSYADEHAGAIRLFEEVRSSHPLRADEFLMELADQYKWDGKRREAIREYDIILKAFPDRKDALLGKADILSWDGDLEGALALFEKVLLKDPREARALNGRARVLVWQGYHRRGIARYREILKDRPDDLDALEGLAFAYHWDGQDLLASRTLARLFALRPDRAEAKNLARRIDDARYPALATRYVFFADSNEQTVQSFPLRATGHLDPGTAVEVLYERQSLRKAGALRSAVDADRAGVGMSRDLGERFAFDAYLYQTRFSKVDFEPFTTNTWLTYKPDDIVRAYLAYDRETFQDNDALYHHIVAQGPSLSVDLKPNRTWSFNAKYKRSYLSDENRQNQISSKAEFRISRKPFAKAYYNYYYSDWAEADLGHGYFNPFSVVAHSLGVYSGIDVTDRLFAEGQVSGGYEFQHKADLAHKVSNHPTLFAGGGFNYRLSPDWLVSVRGEYFTTWPDHGQKSYSNRTAMLRVTYNFGGAHVSSEGAGRPSRVTNQ